MWKLSPALLSPWVLISKSHWLKFWLRMFWIDLRSVCQTKLHRETLTATLHEETYGPSSYKQPHPTPHETLSTVFKFYVFSWVKEQSWHCNSPLLCSKRNLIHRHRNDRWTPTVPTVACNPSLEGDGAFVYVALGGWGDGLNNLHSSKHEHALSLFTACTFTTQSQAQMPTWMFSVRKTSLQ